MQLVVHDAKDAFKLAASVIDLSVCVRRFLISAQNASEHGKFETRLPLKSTEFGLAEVIAAKLQELGFTVRLNVATTSIRISWNKVKDPPTM
jgi:hypothetical protein